MCRGDFFKDEGTRERLATLSYSRDYATRREGRSKAGRSLEWSVNMLDRL